VNGGSPGEWPGHDPDVLDSLANERNGLAWQRTALAWVASGAAVARYFSTDGLLTTKTSIGFLMLAVGALVWFDGARRYHRHAANIRADEPMPVPMRSIRLVALATTFAVAAIVTIEITQW
jgi:putative membrane protein